MFLAASRNFVRVMTDIPLKTCTQIPTCPHSPAEAKEAYNRRQRRCAHVDTQGHGSSHDRGTDADGGILSLVAVGPLTMPHTGNQTVGMPNITLATASAKPETSDSSPFRQQQQS